MWNIIIWSRIGSSDGLFEHGNELPGFIKDGEFFEKLSNISFFRNYIL
jgi:hypothetical protein